MQEGVVCQNHYWNNKPLLNYFNSCCYFNSGYNGTQLPNFKIPYMNDSSYFCIYRLVDPSPVIMSLCFNTKRSLNSIDMYAYLSDLIQWSFHHVERNWLTISALRIFCIYYIFTGAMVLCIVYMHVHYIQSNFIYIQVYQGFIRIGFKKWLSILYVKNKLFYFSGVSI